MGKLLDVLRRNEGGQPPVLSLPTRPAPVEAVLPLRIEPEAELDPGEEEYLFIEVGGPDRKVDGSPAVLASAKPKAAPAQQTLPIEAKPSAAVAPVLSKTAPLSVSFEAWPADGQPAPRIAPEIITYHQPDHPASKQYAELFRKATEGLGKPAVLIFSGAEARSGTTTVLLNLAFSGCRLKRRIVVVETQLASPVLAERLGLKPAPGWHELLAGHASLEKSLHATADPHLFAFVAGATGPDNAIAPEAWAWVIGWLRERFDLVLVDGPDATDRGGLKLILPSSDGIYLVVPQAMCEDRQVNELAQGVMRLGGRLRGLIHTQIESLSEKNEE